MTEQANNPTFSADLDDATVNRLDAHAMSRNIGIGRRMALTACARDSDALLKLAREEPETLEEMAGHVLDFQEHAQAVNSVAESAFARIAAVRQAVWGDVFDA